MKIVDYSGTKYENTDVPLNEEIKKKYNCGFITVDDLISKLPKQVIKNGQVINVRENVAKDMFNKNIDHSNKDSKKEEPKEIPSTVSKDFNKLKQKKEYQEYINNSKGECAINLDPHINIKVR